ncbi:MAG: acetoacetate--CoA ligase [Burkholderiales bacterium]|nr:acetoacetate--CoA ligase [Burkholderiales bacterium]
MNHPAPLWRPSAERIERAAITRYRRWLKDRKGLDFADYESLWQWSVTDIEAFWESIWEFSEVRSHSPYRRVLDRRVMPGAKWFEGATLNYAEHALARAERSDAATRPALIHQSEIRSRGEMSWTELAGQVGAMSATLEALGVRPGDRVVSYMPNIPESVIALLAAASCGGVWSSCSPDMGPVSVLDRFRQIEPRVLFAVDGYRYGGKDYDRRDVVRELVAQLPTLEAVIFVPYLDANASIDLGKVPVTTFAQATAQPRAPKFKALPFDHPLWIVYSSGTTGMPKPIVHSHGGTVIETCKGSALALDVGDDDRFFWFSSTSWIMWNVLVSALTRGATILQFDGNPGYPDLGTLWRFVARERATFVGISPAFIALCAKNGYSPRQHFDLAAIRTVGCTGSPLTEEGYEWVYRNVHDDLMLASISGGTDPGTAFVGACPILPIYSGEMQCRGLGIATYAYDDEGKPVLDQVGELVCSEPFPSAPLYFWGDQDGKRYFESYFDVWPGVWRHGDWLKLIPRPESVTAVIYGRSDSTINRHGIRMGTSELYRVVEGFDEVADSLVVDLEYLGRPSFMALFVVLRSGGSEVPAPLKQALLQAIRTGLSARHVPDDVFVITEVPRTISGKKMEVPVKKILLGQPVEKAANRDSMANPKSLDWFVAFAKQREAKV